MYCACAGLICVLEAGHICPVERSVLKILFTWTDVLEWYRAIGSVSRVYVKCIIKSVSNVLKSVQSATVVVVILICFRAEKSAYFVRESVLMCVR